MIRQERLDLLTCTLKFFVLMMLIVASHTLAAQNPANWTNDQLIEPQELAAAIREGNEVPVILGVGPDDLIPGTIHAGPMDDKRQVKRFTNELKKLDRDKNVVVYCGCCPFEHCPNVRPAIDLLKKMNFTNYRLLNLPQNIKVDWINKGYPVK